MRAMILGAAVMSCGLALAACRAIQGLGDLTFDVADTGTGTSAGTASGVEDCTNAEDDDGDGLIDCADPDCGAAGFACVAAPPKGWNGPVALFEGPFGEAVPACPSIYPDLEYQGDTGPEAQPATCGECDCGPGQATCSVELSLFKSGNCKGSSAPTAPLTPGSCVKLDGSASSLELSASTATVSACAPSGGAANVPPLERSTSGVSCGAIRRSGGCSAGKLCVPRPMAPFREARCISTKDAQSCPASYPEPHRLETVSDSRGCTPCTCSDAAPPSCAATTTLFSDVACGVQIASLPNDGGCVSSMPVAAMVAITGGGSVSCVAQGGSPTGAVKTVSQATICCSE